MSNQISLTIETIQKAKLTKFMFLSIFLAVVAITVFIIGFTSISAYFLTIETTWLKNILVGLVGIAGVIAGWFLLPSLIILINSIFQENIIDHIEKIYYPDRVRAEGPRLFAEIKYDVKFAVLSIAINIIILPLYFFGIGIFVAIIANTYLLGREFFENVAGYHIGKENAHKLGKQNQKIVYANGLLFTLASITPFLNLITPVIATVWMTHTYHKKLYITGDKISRSDITTTSDTSDSDVNFV